MSASITTDNSGFAVFSQGETGYAHVVSHEMLDNGHFLEGRRFLGDWLQGRTGEGADWVHLQWHMAIFEIATGSPREAFSRFQEHILPVVPFEEAETDAPSLLWRLDLCTGGSLDIDWEAVREVAASRSGQGLDPYVELHHLLAFAGSRDVDALDRWLDRCSSRAETDAERTLLRLGWGVRTFASRDYGAAATLLAANADEVGQLGGSRAQNELFFEIANEARERSEQAAAHAAL